MPRSTSFSDSLKPYEDHFSVLKIKEKYKIRKRFQFREFPCVKQENSCSL